MSLMFLAAIIAGLTSYCIIGSDYRREHVLEDDATALAEHHSSLAKYVQHMEAHDAEDLTLPETRTLLEWTKARLDTMNKEGRFPSW